MLAATSLTALMGASHSGSEGLQEVVPEGEGGDGVAGRHDDQQGRPQVQEGGKGAERLVDVRVVAAGLGDHGAWKAGKMHLIHSYYKLKLLEVVVVKQ